MKNIDYKAPSQMKKSKFSVATLHPRPLKTRKIPIKLVKTHLIVISEIGIVQYIIVNGDL